MSRWACRMLFFFIALCNGKENPNNSVLAITHQGTVITWIFQIFTFAMWNNLTLLFLWGTRKMVKVRLYLNTIWWEMREFVLSWACNFCCGNREITSDWERVFLKEKMECNDISTWANYKKAKQIQNLKLKSQKWISSFEAVTGCWTIVECFNNKTLCY